MTDPLAELEMQTGIVRVSDVPENPLDIPRAELDHARARIVELEGLYASEKERADSLSAQLKKTGGSFGKKKQVVKLTAEVADLKAEVARLKAERKAERDTGKLLPAVVEANTQLALAEQRHGAETHKMMLAMAASEAMRGEAMEALGEMEYQRDERDDKLRKEEVKRRNSDIKVDRTSRQITQMRLAYLRSNAPVPTGDDDGKNKLALARKRVLAALGNVGAQVELGHLDNDCALCRAAPACTRTRLLVWPHGQNIDRSTQDYLQLLVDEAQAMARDPFAALETWASGVDMETFDPLTLPPAPSTDPDLDPEDSAACGAENPETGAPCRRKKHNGGVHRSESGRVKVEVLDAEPDPLAELEAATAETETEESEVEA